MKKNYFTRFSVQSYCAVCFVFVMFFVSSANAQKNIGWTGATNNNWSTTSNWNYPAITSVGNFGFAATVIKLTAPNTEIAIGDKVAGFGIPVGATVIAIDSNNQDVTISAPTNASVGTPGTNVVFTFATPKPATSAPTILTIAVISNGANIILQSGSYYLGGLTISNATGAITGSTLTIPEDAEVFVESLTNEAVLIKGGNIVNNGYLDIKSSLTGGSNNQAGAYGMTFGLPAVVPNVPIEYTYSGIGTLKIDTSAGNQNSGAFYFNGFGENAANATYKMLFNGPTIFVLSDKKTSPTGSANTHVIRATGTGALAACKIILGGAGFDLGDSFSGGINGLFAGSGPGINLTIEKETVFNVYTNQNFPMSVIGFYVYGGTATPSNFINKGVINVKGALQRSAISLSTEYGGIVNIINEGLIDLDLKTTLANQAGFFVAGYQAPQINLSECNLINSGTINIKNQLNGISGGLAIYSYVDGNKSPFVNITNTGTLNLSGSNFSTGGRAFSSASPSMPGTRLINSGIINTNQEFRQFNTTNESTGIITFASTAENTNKLMTFSVVSTVAAAVGTKYTDSNSNVYTVAATKVGGTGTTLVTTVASNILNPLVILASLKPPTEPSLLTKTGAGAGDASVIFTALTSNNFNGHYTALSNSGRVNTNPGNTLLTGFDGFVGVGSSNVLSPGGDTKNGLITLLDIPGDALTLKGILKMQASGTTTAGVDYDAIKFNGFNDFIDISGVTLDLTGIFIPATKLIIDIITTNTLQDFEGTIIGEFSSIIAPKGWKVIYTEGFGNKVQLEFDPALTTTQFAQAEFNYFPNPTKGQLNLTAVKNIDKVSFYNVLGQKVQDHVINDVQKQIDITTLKSGLYFMEVTIENNKKSFKVFKQ